ncbi:MAG: hypothetical protein WB709_09800 [Solirubrobacteraceae bacterium]
MAPLLSGAMNQATIPDCPKLPFSLVTEPQNVADSFIALAGNALKLSLDRRPLNELSSATGQPENRAARHDQHGHYDHHRHNHDHRKKGEHPTSGSP